MSRIMRPLVLATGLLAACAAIAVTAGIGSAKSASKGKATSGVVYAAIVHTVGKTEYAAGLVNDKVLGKGAVEFALTVGEGSKPGSLTGKGAVTVFTSTGQLSGTDSVDITTTSTGATFSNGKLDLTKGEGLQKGHSFVGTFTGTAKSILGPYTFEDKGTYK
jgi:hypothetical protein